MRLQRRILPRPHTLLLFLVAVACACGASPYGLVMRDVSFPVRDLRFPSGLRVIVAEDHRSPLVGVVMLVGSGSTSDPPGKEGLAHYVEHLTFRSRPDGKLSVRSLTERAGAASWDAYTELDETLYWSLGPKEALPALVLLEGVRLLAPVTHVEPEVAAVELDVVKNELRQRNETGVAGAITGWMQAAVFPAEHPYARPIAGSRESLAGLTLEDAQRFAKAHYRPDNVTLVVIGDVDLQTVGRAVEESLPHELLTGAGGAPEPRLAPVASPPPPSPAAPMARHEASVATPELWVGWSLPRSFDAEGYLGRFVEVSASGYLSNAFSHDEDITRVTVHLVRGKEAAMLLCQVSLRDASHPEKSLDNVLNQLVDLWLGKRANDPRFARLQRSAVTSLVLGSQYLVTQGRERAELAHFSGDAAAYSRTLGALMSTDVGAVASFAARYLTRDRARAVLVTPPPSGARPQPEREAAAPAPLQDPPLPFDAQSIRQFIRAPGVSGYRRIVLENGIEVIIGRRAGLPLATVGLSLRGGTATAAPPGAAELALRLGVAKVTSRVQPGDFGGHIVRRDELDELRYTFEGSSGNVGSMLEMLADRAPNMHVDPGAMSSFGAYVIPSLERLETVPEAQANRAFRGALYGEHPYGRSVLGVDLARLGAGDANDWISRVTVGRNAVLAIVGEVDPDEVLRLVRDTFGRWPAGSADAALPPPALPSARAPRPTLLVTHRPGATQGQVQLGCLLPPPSAARARTSIMESLLTTRVSGTVRGSLGASYGFSTSSTTLRGGVAQLRLHGDVDNAHLAEALAVVKSSLEALEQGRFSASELADARWRAARAYAVRFQSNESIVSAILSARSVERDVSTIDAFPSDVAAVTADDVKADFARCNTAPVLSLVGDEPTLRAALASVWP